MNTDIRILFTLGVVALLLWSCSADEGTGTGNAPGVIRFVSGPGSKSGSVSGSGFAAGTEVGVYAFENTTGNAPTPDDARLMDNQACRADGVGGLTYKPVQYYKENARYSFYAYYPYTADAVFSLSGTSPVLACTFASQIDYMYATPLENCEPSSEAQQLVFHHALTQIRLEIANHTKKKLVLHTIRLHGPGSATLDIASGQWLSPGDWQTYALYGPAGDLEIAAGSTVSVPGQLMLLPSEGTGASYTFDISATRGDDSSPTEQKGVALTLPAGGLNAGVSYLYTVSYTADEEEKPNEPDEPDDPNDPNDPNDPDTPDIPDVPDIPVDPDPDVPDVPDTPDNPVTITFKSTLSAWTLIDVGDTEVH